MNPNDIFEALRKKIIRLELEPETVLNLSELAEEFNVSRTPIKEVLILLQAEEWIVRNGSHFIVTPLSLERIREVTEIRMVLELQANLWAMQRITGPELKKLKALENRITDFSEKSSNQAIVDFDFQIHHYIFSTAKNAHLARLLEKLLYHYLRFWLSIPRQIDVDKFFTEVRALIKAIEDKDEARVKECTTAHIRNSVAKIMGTA